MLRCFGVEPDDGRVALMINLCLTVVILRRAIPDTLPLLVPEAAGATVDFQIDAIIAALARMRGGVTLYPPFWGRAPFSTK